MAGQTQAAISFESIKQGTGSVTGSLLVILRQTWPDFITATGRFSGLVNHWPTER